MTDPGRIRTPAEVGIMAALALALSFITIWQLPFGGKISLEMLPIYVLARFRGFKEGCAAGFLFGILDLFREPRVVHPAQFLLDYPLAFTALGLAGIFPAGRKWDAIGVIAGGAVRFLCHFFSGIIFFGSYAPSGEPVWAYSLIYNASYLVPSLLACIVLISPIVAALQHAFPSENISPR